jgi:hypothetical protein
MSNEHKHHIDKNLFKVAINLFFIFYSRIILISINSKLILNATLDFRSNSIIQSVVFNVELFLTHLEV